MTTPDGVGAAVGAVTPLIRLTGSAVVDPGFEAGAAASSWEPPIGGDGPLAGLSRREIEVCALHWVDGWTQATVAHWLGMTPRGVSHVLETAVAKAPALAAVRGRAEAPAPRVHVVHLSQLPRADRTKGAFDADEV